MMKQLRTFVITSLAAVAGAGLVTMARSQNPSSAAVASFNVDGSLNLPRGYRHWVHIGTRLKPIGINILDGLPTKTPEIFNAYVEPHAFTLFRKTGRGRTERKSSKSSVPYASVRAAMRRPFFAVLQ